MRQHNLGAAGAWRRVFGGISSAVLLVAMTVAALPAAAGAEPTVTMLKDINPNGDSFAEYFTEMNGMTYFLAATDLANEEYGLWKSDGTAAGTVLVKGDIVEDGYILSGPSMVAHNGAVYFSLAGPNFGKLWKSDGTPDGTTVVKSGIYVVEPMSVGNTLYFSGTDGPQSGLWKTDGTEAGTVFVKAVGVTTTAVMNDTLYFMGSEGDEGPELWKSDGTAAGTVKVKEIQPGPDGSYIGPLVKLGDTIYFPATDGAVVGSQEQAQLWKTDGTEAGTVKVKDSIASFGMMTAGGKLFFDGYIATDGTQRGLWTSDGTDSGTVFLAELEVQSVIVPLGSDILFKGGNETAGLGLWKSDGTAAGTVLVANEAAVQNINDLTAAGDVVYFSADDGEHGQELWKSDGTSGGTGMVKDIKTIFTQPEDEESPPDNSSNPSLFKYLNDKLFFAADDGVHGNEAWVLTSDADVTAPVISAVNWNTNPLLQGQNTTLSVTASDNLAVETVEYTIDGGARQAMAFNSATNTWTVSFGANLGVNTYNITVIATDSAGNETASADVLAVYNAANGYVTGHAKLLPTATDVLPIGLDTSNTPAKLTLGLTNIKAGTSTMPTTGSFDAKYVIKNNQNEFSLSSTSVEWLVVPDATHASIQGKATLVTYVDGVSTIHQNVTVRIDSTLGTPNRIVLKMYDTGVNPATSAPTWQIDQNADHSQIMIKP